MGFRYNFLKTQIAKATERKRHNERRRIFTRCEDAANRYDFNSKFNDHVKTL